jgi:hypothetical protein
MTEPNANRPEHEQSEAWTVDPYVGKPYGFKRVLPASPNGRDPFAGMPWWVRAVALVGVPALISMGLVWFGAQSIATNVAANGTKVAAVSQEMQLHDAKVQTQFEELRRESAVQTRYLRTLCQAATRNDPVLATRCVE